MLEKSRIEISTLKSDLATLVGAVDDIRKRQSRPAEPPRTPLPPARASRTTIAAAAALILALGMAAWGMLSMAAYDVAEPPPIETVTTPPVVEPTVPIAEVVPVSAPATAAVVPPAPVPVTARAPATVRDPADPPPPERSASSAYVGSLSIDSSPAGEVFVDRKNVGRTPVRLDNLRAGSHLVWIEREGHRRFTRVVAVAANRVSRVTADLDPIR